VANVFRTNRSQAVRLPKVAEFPPDVTEVDVIIEGDRRVLVPRSKLSWDDYFAQRTGLSSDAVITDDDMAPLDDVSLDV
jgi:antitoxin VapB